jgi:hypothetical protein
MDPFILAAIVEAETGLSEGGVPIGSVVVQEKRAGVRDQQAGALEWADSCASVARPLRLPTTRFLNLQPRSPCGFPPYLPRPWDSF